MKKATVIGVGNLGSCIAYEIANRGLVDHLVLIDVAQELAEGNAADIAQAMAFRANVDVTVGDYENASGSQVIVVTAGRPRTPEMKSRSELLEANSRIIKAVASSLKGADENSVIITLTNPVDAMNFIMWKNTGLDRRRVIGSAGMLDSARFRTVLAGILQVPKLAVEAYVVGEHGDNQVPLFSQVQVGNKTRLFTEDERSFILGELKRSALEVIAKKGATIFAPANNTANMVQMILKDEKKTAVCSVVLDGEYGLNNVSIGVPVVLGRNGVEKVLEWELNKKEMEAFTNGAESLKKTIKALFSSQLD
jgi:malate dehydrogenase